MRVIRASDCRVMPWKNGGGTTTEIAVSPEGASLSDFDWRISMAHVGADGPFSSFPGIDRTLSVLNGGGIRLVFSDGECVALNRRTEPFAFAADRAVTGQLVAGPIDDLNVMSRRRRWSHDVRRLSDAGPHRWETGEGLIALVAKGGRWLVESATGSASLAAGDSVIVQAPVTAEREAGSDGDLFAIRLRTAD